MTVKKVKLTLHMVSSLDGFIAKKDNSVSWFETSSQYDGGDDMESLDEISKEVDCYVMGSNTYEHATELSKDYGWPYGETPTIVLTNRDLRSERSNVTFYSGELKQLVSDRLEPKFTNVWVVGGSVLTRDFLMENLIDEIRMTILPILLGNGLPFFHQIGKEHNLHLIEAKALKMEWWNCVTR